MRSAAHQHADCCVGVCWCGQLQHLYFPSGAVYLHDHARPSHHAGSPFFLHLPPYCEMMEKQKQQEESQLANAPLT